MAMAWLWTGMVAVSLVFGILTGSVGELGGAALEGATAAVELCVSMAGIMCLWTGVMEVMEQCGLSAALARLFLPAAAAAAAGSQPRSRNARRHLRQPFRQPARARQRGNAAGHPRRAAHGAGLRRVRRRMSSACSLCSTPRPFSCCRRPSPACAARSAAPIRSIFCPPSGPPPCSLSSRGLPRRSCLRGSGGGEGVSLSELVVPVLLCFTACYALGETGRRLHPR